MKTNQPMRSLLSGVLAGLLFCAALGMTTSASAHGTAHVHGLVRLDIAIDGKTVAVQLDAPLDSLLGFEHQPRTEAQKQAAQALLKKLNDDPTLIRPQGEAACKPSPVTVESETLQSTKPNNSKDEAHADLEARFEFVCEQPEKLTFMEIGLFDAFKRIGKIEVQVAGSQGQSKQTLKRPEKMVRLRR